METGEPSLYERLRIFWSLLFLPVAMMIGLFDPINRGRTWRRAANDSVIRYMTSRRWNIRQIKYVTGPTTEAVYEAWSKKHGLQSQVEEIGSGAKLLWFGTPQYGRVLLWMHGGGFGLPASPGQHLDFLQAIEQELQGSLEHTGVALLNCSLAPHSRFPTQLTQLVSAIRYLVSQGTSPMNIVLGGDSAGGSLVLQLFSHILRPFPGIPQLSLPGPFAGAVLISPWISFADKLPPVHDRRDISDPAFDDYLCEIARPQLTPDNRPYYDPSSAPESWWVGLDGIVKEVLVTAGEVERYKAEIVKLGSKLATAHPHVVQRVEPNAVHINLLIDFGAGQGKGTDAWRLLTSWLVQCYAVS